MIYSDGDLIFDKETMRYYLNKDYVASFVDLKTVVIDEFLPNQSNAPEEYIRYACDVLWDFIDKNAVEKISTKYYFTQNKEAYIALKRALKMQLLRFIQVGDTDNGVGFKSTDRLHKGAVNALYGIGAFHVLITNIPLDVEEW